MIDEEENDESLLSSGADQQSTSRASARAATPVPPDSAIRILRKFFGHKSFRPLQWSVIENALKGMDQVVVMST
ncbi:unnamed protein product, partial [Gongylonema pulchrum]|uniref:ABC transporter n=1 Tax=Gongylonema pulchrum TaxID=637853 RepID=A0A183F154_9BILA